MDDNIVTVGTSSAGLGAALMMVFNRWLMNRKEESMNAEIERMKSQLSTEMRAITSTINEFRLSLVRDYVPRNEIEHNNRTVFEKLDNINEKMNNALILLERKADRH